IDANRRAIAAMPHAMPCGHYAQWLEYGYLQKKDMTSAKKMLDACRAAEPSSDGFTLMTTMFVASGGPFDREAKNPYAAALDAFHRRDLDALNTAASVWKPSDDKRAAARERSAIIRQQIDAMRLSLEGKHDEAIATLRKAAESERAMPLEFGPPYIDKPTLELLGDELMAAGRAAEAVQAYREALARTPGRTLTAEGLQRAQSR
ncbi:MAG TPA: hypothetical protein VLU46_05080, partial [Thermoanaerobaculia bacterium]|nr:hypothetical protein [Thermoanaerobaculia bacterium]